MKNKKKKTQRTTRSRLSQLYLLQKSDKNRIRAEYEKLKSPRLKLMISLIYSLFLYISLITVQNECIIKKKADIHEIRNCFVWIK